jgi:hypothetical protein
LAVLKYLDPKALIQNFEKTWGVKPEAVVLPVNLPDGLLFPVNGISEQPSTYSTSFAGGLKDFHDIVLAFSQEDISIYLLADPTLPFIQTAALHVVDIVGDSSAQACLGNPRTQDIVAAILGTAIDITIETTKKSAGKLKGVVIDTVDLFPMGGKKERLELTCFCPSCETFFKERNASLLTKFKTFPNPWNLLLRATDTGMEHSHNVRLNHSAEDIVGLSRQKAFHEVFEDKSTGYLVDQASTLLEYIRIRHDQVIASIDAIFNQALEGLESQPTRVLLTEGFYYDWTSGIQLERLDHSSSESNPLPYDEVWFDSPSTGLYFKDLSFRSYMWTRSRYYIDAFFQLAANATDPVRRQNTGLSRFSPERLKNLLGQRLNQAIGGASSGQTALTCLPNLKASGEPSQRIGFVGVALTKDIGESIIDGLQIPSVYVDRSNSDMDEGELMQAIMSMMNQQGR